MGDRRRLTLFGHESWTRDERKLLTNHDGYERHTETDSATAEPKYSERPWKVMLTRYNYRRAADYAP